MGEASQRRIRNQQFLIIKGAKGKSWCEASGPVSGKAVIGDHVHPLSLGGERHGECGLKSTDSHPKTFTRGQGHLVIRSGRQMVLLPGRLGWKKRQRANRERPNHVFAKAVARE